MIATENLKGRSGVYCAIHRDSLKCYVGSSCDVGKRMNQHIESARNGSNGNFHRAIREFGANAFDFELIENVEKSELKQREDFWIKFYDAASLNGFNTLPYSCSFVRGKASEVTKARISASKRGQVSDRLKLHLKKLQASNVGREKSLDERARMSERMKGHRNTPAQIESMRQKLMGRPAVAATAAARIANTGRERTPECKAKIKQKIQSIWNNRSESRKAEIMANAWKSRGI